MHSYMRWSCSGLFLCLAVLVSLRTAVAKFLQYPSGVVVMCGPAVRCVGISTIWSASAVQSYWRSANYWNLVGGYL